ncbi:CidA/LrgA family protein [Alteromonas pelagimontana]|uniref:CidA/LrgA family protein n=1 Tax=Alteromonas pelagimontana TaxID=1858656 RepID=A0A6M4MFP7_9ALTE|nr:CidA/LrgA family protein [Alteromonas pelagimontana]QJR81708.1 CidA/LrgA family protein [Alteromonas pelagimontana]
MLKHHLVGWFWLLFSFFLGEFLVAWFGIAIPGALMGLLLLLLFLTLRKRTPLPLTTASRPLLKHMVLLFVPAVLGVGLYRDEIAQNLFAVVGAIVITTTVSLGLTAWVAQRVLRHGRQEE